MANGATPAWIKEVAKYGGVGGGFGGAILVVWLAIAQPMREDFRNAQSAMTTEVAGLRTEFAKFRMDFTEWTRQVFVSKDLFERANAEYERRIAVLEKK